MTMPRPMHYATTCDGVRIAYMSLGDGPPVVWASNIFGDLNAYLDGWPATKECTDRAVSQGWRVILYDVRGMGFSERNVADLELADRVLDIEAVVTALNLDRFALAAVDIGAATAVAYAVRNLAKVSRLVLLSPWSSGTKYLAIPALRAALAAEDVSNGDRQLFANLLGSVATSFKDPELVRLLAEGHLKATSPEGFAAYNAANRRIDITELLPRVTAPTLVIHEPAFPFGSFELCQEVATRIPGAEFLIVSDHSIAGRVHDETVTGIDRFLRGVAGTQVSSNTNAKASGDTVAAPNGLTAREVQILRKVAEGFTNKAIASEFHLAVSTVERHRVNLYNKIGARGRADAIGFALRNRL
jgi:pimeloyl-ACP methyl ester carboxylesterase/DNA-binding CsgD family transcriptional regulator